VEKWLGKLNDPTLDPYLDKKATLGKPNDVKPNLESNYTLAKGKKPEKIKLYLKFGGFKGGIVWNIDCFMHKQIETGKAMNPSTLNPWKFKF